MEKIYKGSDGITVSIYGYGEALAALSTAPPAPAPAPAPSTTPVPLTLAPGVNQIIGATSGRTYLATAVDGAIIDVHAAGIIVGLAFTIVLSTTGTPTLTVRESVTSDVVFTVPTGTQFVRLEFKVLGTGFVSLIDRQFSPS